MKRVNYMSAGLIAMTFAGVMLPITSVFAADEPIKKTSVGEVRVGVDPDNPDPNNPDSKHCRSQATQLLTNRLRTNQQEMPAMGIIKVC